MIPNLSTRIERPTNNESLQSYRPLRRRRSACPDRSIDPRKIIRFRWKCFGSTLSITGCILDHTVPRCERFRFARAPPRKDRGLKICKSLKLRESANLDIESPATTSVGQTPKQHQRSPSQTPVSEAFVVAHSPHKNARSPSWAIVH